MDGNSRSPLHEYVEDEYHNQHVADVGRRTWQHPPTKLMAPIQRVKPARLLMSPSNTNGKQTEIKEEENTNKKKPESSDIGQNPRPLKSERIKTCWYSPKIDVVNIQLFAAQIKGTCNLCLQTLVRRTRSLCSALKKYRKSVFNEFIKVKSLKFSSPQQNWEATQVLVQVAPNKCLITALAAWFYCLF